MYYKVVTISCLLEQKIMATAQGTKLAMLPVPVMARARWEGAKLRPNFLLWKGNKKLEQELLPGHSLTLLEIVGGMLLAAVCSVPHVST